MPANHTRDLRLFATPAERRVWSLIRNRQIAGLKFRRQHPIGPFIADFACVEAMLVVEIDGGQHAENRCDAWRTAKLRELGWTVIRFWNNEVMERPEGVVLAIESHAPRGRAAPSPDLSPSRAGGEGIGQGHSSK